MALEKRRTLVQTLSLLLLHSSLWGQQVTWFCTPVLSCHSCVLSWFACPVGVFIHFSSWHVWPLIPIATVLILGVLVGRLLCGWVCPFGFLQDLLHKIPGKKLKLPPWTCHVRYFVLAIMVLIIPYFFGEEAMLSFCRICPASALQVTIPGLIQGSSVAVGTIVKLSVLVAVIALAIVAERSFCRVICPIGAFLAPLNFLSFWKVKTPAACLGCKKCNKQCPAAGQPSTRVSEGIEANRALECIVCHRCQGNCPDLGEGVRTLSRCCSEKES